MNKFNNNKSKRLDRRKFLNVAGIAVTLGLSPISSWAKKVDLGIVNDEPINDEIPEELPPANRTADVIEVKTICIEPGKFLGQGTEYAPNINGYMAITKRAVEPNRYIAWPTILRVDDDNLIVAFSGDRDAHICPFGKTQIIRSSDQGKTWSTPKTITNTPLDDRDAGLIQTKKGTLLISWFTSLAFESPSNELSYNKYARIGEKISQETRKQWLGNWVRRSEDNGKTWLAPSKTLGSAPHGPISLQNGHLLYVGFGKWSGKSAIIVEKSLDDGKTWNAITEIPRPTNFDSDLSEPHVVELKSGKLIAMIRNEPKDRSKCFLLQSESNDGGETWSVMKSTGIWGYPPHLMQLSNGSLMVCYGYRKKPYGLRACISKDQGQTWDITNEIILSNAASEDLGYPSSIQFADNSILTVFYQAANFGEPAILKSAHWNLK